MTTANELITRALRLINVPGRGATLAAEDQSNALLALQEILDSQAVSKAFVPGIRRHFFTLNASQSIYSYGAGSGFDLRSDAFGLFRGDPAPIRIESAYIRQGSTITDNEKIDEYRFGNLGDWILTGGLAIADDQLAVELAVGTATQSLAVDLTGATTYTLRARIDVNAGSALVELRNNAVTFESYVFDASGDYEYDFVWPAGTVPDVKVTSAITDDFSMTLLSLIERGQQRLTLPDRQGTDYPIRAWDQTDYNRQGVKGSSGVASGGGAIGRYLYTRSAGQAGDLRFDNVTGAGDILIMDVAVNTVTVDQPDDELQLNPEALHWLRYKLADVVSGEYGKSLARRQLEILAEAWDQLATSNRRVNMLGMPDGLRQRGRFDINTGGSY